MGRKRERIRASKMQGCRYFKLIPEILQSLHTVGTQRDKAGNREFFCDQYVSLLLLYFFSPVVTSLNRLQEATGLDKVQKKLGIKRVSMGTLSESAGVFDPAPLQDIVRELTGRAVPLVSGAETQTLQGLHGGGWFGAQSVATHGVGSVAGRAASRRQAASARVGLFGGMCCAELRGGRA